MTDEKVFRDTVDLTRDTVDLTRDVAGIDSTNSPPKGVKGIWDTITLYIRELIVAAETRYIGAGQGEIKKKWVEDKVMDLIEQWEATSNKIPDFIEGFVFMALRKAVDMMIERIFTALEKAGEVNVISPAS